MYMQSADTLNIDATVTADIKVNSLQNMYFDLFCKYLKYKKYNTMRRFYASLLISENKQVTSVCHDGDLGGQEVYVGTSPC